MASVTRRRDAGQVRGENIVIEAAWLYYHDGLNQNEIATRLQVSRATVVNYLQEARERGYIRISLSSEAFTSHQLAQDLRERFGVAAACVLPEGPDGAEETLMRVARGAAEWLPGLLEPGDRLGVAWGRTVYEVAEAVERAQVCDVTVIQLVGSMASPYGFTAEACSARMAQNLGARCINLHAPAVLSDPELAGRLRNEPIIRAQLDALSNCNKAIFAAAQPDRKAMWSEAVSPAATILTGIFAMARQACFAAASSTPAAGIPGALDERMIGVTLDRLQGLDAGILVSTGADKVRPMLAAIAGGYVTHVVTSDGTARLMLEAD